MHPSELFEQRPNVKELGLETEAKPELRFDPERDVSASDRSDFQKLVFGLRRSKAWLSLMAVLGSATTVDPELVPLIRDDEWKEIVNLTKEWENQGRWTEYGVMVKQMSIVDPGRIPKMEAHNEQQLLSEFNQSRHPSSLLTELVVRVRPEFRTAIPDTGQQTIFGTWRPRETDHPFSGEEIEHWRHFAGVIREWVELHPHQSLLMSGQDWDGFLRAWKYIHQVNLPDTFRLHFAANLTYLAQVEARQNQQQSPDREPLPVTPTF